MPTEEFKPLLDRQEAIKHADPLINAACPLLREVVNHSAWAMQRCHAASDALGAENEDLAPFVLYRHIIELTDGMEVMFASSAVDAAVPVLRAQFEASLSLDFILRDDYVRRSLAWTCAYMHQRIDAHETLDATTATGAAYAKVWIDESKEPHGHVYDAGPSVAALRSVLAREQFKELNAEYVKLRKKLGYAPDWFKLVGIKSRKQLARAIQRETEYASMYGMWSGFSHAADASAYVRPGRHDKEMAFLAVRSPHQMAHRAFLAVGMMIRATRQMVDHFRKGESLEAWYLRDVQQPWMHLQRIKVVSPDDANG
jgi:hypothetical protein